MSDKEKSIAEIQKLQNVSRETFDLLDLFSETLKKWNQVHNLIARSTEEHIWSRHILDSAQLLPHIKKDDVIMDIGSGAGFPGLVLSIINQNKVILVEKSAKKAAFLNEIKFITKANVEVKNCSIEETKIPSPDIITCRGLASVTRLFEITEGKTSGSTVYLLLKGENWNKEVDDAKAKGWNFDLKTQSSITCKDSAVLIIRDVRKR